MTFWSALVLGVLASAHCAGMCGGLQMALQSGSAHHPLRDSKQALLHLLLLNLGRISTYVTAGLLLGFIGLGLMRQLPLQEVAFWMRNVAGVLIALIGIQLVLSNRRPFQWLEQLGARVWQRVSPLMNVQSVRLSHSFAAGLAWGFLPCGLVYSVLLTAVFAADAVSSAYIMLGFGLGTLPSMVLTGSAYHSFRRYSHSASLRLIGGLFFILGGVLILTAPYWINRDFLQHYPELVNLIFCVR